MAEQDKVNKVDMHREIVLDLNQMYASKNADYGDSFASLRHKYPNAILIRLADKLNRLERLMPGNQMQVHDESIEDTLRDLANYAIMEIVEMKVDALKNERMPLQACSTCPDYCDNPALRLGYCQYGWGKGGTVAEFPVSREFADKQIHPNCPKLPKSEAVAPRERAAEIEPVEWIEVTTLRDWKDGKREYVDAKDSNYRKTFVGGGVTFKRVER